MSQEQEPGPILPGPELDKLTGCLYLQECGLPVPRLFTGITEALSSGSGWPLFARIFVHGPADSRVIGVFDSRTVASLDVVNKLYRQSVGLAIRRDFGRYCQSFGIDPKGVRVGLFLQNIVGNHDTSCRIIAMNNPDGNTIVQARYLRGGPAWDGQLKERAAELHHKAVAFLDPGYYYQTEIIGGQDEDLSLVQIKPVMPLPHSGIEFQIGVLRETEEKLITDLAQRYSDIWPKAIRIVYPSGPYAGMSVYNIDEGQKLSRGTPYVLTIDPKFLKYQYWSFDWDNIVGLVLNQEYDAGTYLQHKSYRLMRMVWQHGGRVVVHG